jgi:hypothetical protein
MDFRVVEQLWEGGCLSTAEHRFEDLERAVEYANVSTAHTIEVHDAEGRLYHHRMLELYEKTGIQ